MDDDLEELRYEPGHQRHPDGLIGFNSFDGFDGHKVQLFTSSCLVNMFAPGLYFTCNALSIIINPKITG